MSRTSVRRLVLALAITAAALTPAAAVAGGRPFKARLTGNAHLSPTDDPAVLRNDETGQGNATHLGRFTWTDVEFADFSDFPLMITVEATFTMTAANGDQLYGEFTTVGVPAADGSLVIHGHFHFTGGTGRFTDAEGYGQIDAVASTGPDLPFTGTLTGRIDY
ncbi:MAG TPA: hypothetical protein VGF55_23185 [Gemmataceae bacterium]|jgi:hypothetical protein